MQNGSAANNRMATACAFPEDPIISDSQSDSSEDSDSSEESDSVANTDEEEDSDSQVNWREPCKFYNSGGCRHGKKCLYLHICKYALKGNCRYGSRCLLNHPSERRASSEARSRSTSPGPLLTNGRFYQWQLNDGNGWMDIVNDHVIEAQYSLPHTKSIKIYNSPYGAVNIDFRRLRVNGKTLRVRRLDDGNTEWIWFCTLRRKWMKYGDKGKLGAVKSADIENKFQSNPTSSYTFNIGSDTFEIRFRDMRQVSQKRKRKVTRRPLYRHEQAAAAAAAAGVFGAISALTVSTNPQWQFEGGHGTWYTFKNRRGTSTECSVSSEDIERKYQQDPTGSMLFKVGRHSYKLDFGAMTQTKLNTRLSRPVRRV